MLLTNDLLQRACKLDTTTTGTWCEPLNAALEEFCIIKPKQVAWFLAQAYHESGGFKHLTESFNYSVKGLDLFGNRISKEDKERLGRKPGEAALSVVRQSEIANIVYGDRYGNLNEGDGWKFRGRGIFQLTFHENYMRCGKALGLDLVTNPALLTQPINAARSAGWYWQQREANLFVATNDFPGVTKIINGGYNGLNERQAMRLRAENVLLWGK